MKANNDIIENWNCDVLQVKLICLKWTGHSNHEHCQPQEITSLISTFLDQLPDSWVIMPPALQHQYPYS